MRVAFDQTCIGDASEAGSGAKIFERRRARISHARTQTTDKLIYVFTETALIWHTAFDAFRDKLAASALTRWRSDRHHSLSSRPGFPCHDIP